jgi:hypothetical protein
MTVIFTSDQAFQREGFVATVRLVPDSTPSPTSVGDTWAPTTPTPTGPDTCTRECLRATHGAVADRCGCDRDEHKRRRDVELELLKTLSKHQGRVQCCGASHRLPQLHRSGRPAAERTGNAVVQGPHHRDVSHMRGVCKPVAAAPWLAFPTRSRPDWCAEAWRTTPSTAAWRCLRCSRSLSGCTRPPSSAVRAPARTNLGATATVCSDLSDNLVGGTLEPLASLTRLRYLCGPSIAFPRDMLLLLLERPSLRRYDCAKRTCVQRCQLEPDSRRNRAVGQP